jgi:hypothetical protein
MHLGAARKIQEKADADAKVKAAEEGGAADPGLARTSKMHGMADVDDALAVVEEHTEKNPFMRCWAGMKASKCGQAIGNNSVFKHLTFVSALPIYILQCAWECSAPVDLPAQK